MKYLIYPVVLLAILIASCTDVSVNQEPANHANTEQQASEVLPVVKQYDFSTPEEYIREYYRLFNDLSSSYSSNSCTQIPGDFTDDFRSELESTIDVALDPNISDEDRIAYLDDLNELTDSICFPNLTGENFSGIFDELISKFPHLSNLDPEGWRSFVRNALSGQAAKTGPCEDECKVDFAIDVAQVYAVSGAMAAGCGITGPFTGICLGAVGVYFVASYADALVTFDRCMDKCIPPPPPALPARLK